MSPKSIIAENYKYISYTYKLYHTDWTERFSYVIHKSTVPPHPKSIALCNTIRELCEIRDGTKQCEILLNIEFIEALIAQLCVKKIELILLFVNSFVIIIILFSSCTVNYTNKHIQIKSWYNFESE